MAWGGTVGVVRRAAPAALAALSAIGLAACGSSSPAAGPTRHPDPAVGVGAGAGPTTTAPAVPTTTSTVAGTSPGPSSPAAPGATTTTTRAAPPGAPSVTPSAIGSTRLAFVAGSGVLWELSAGAEVQVAAPAGFRASHPVFSADGRWLAFLETPGPTAGSSAEPQLWVARSDGHQAHQVTAALDAESLQWSPSGALLLVTTAGATGPSAVMVISSDGSSRQLASGLVTTAGWSPDGSEVAMSVTNHNATGFTSVIETVPIGGGLPTVWRTSTADVLEVAGWWTNWGIAYWDDPNGSASIAADGLALYVVPGAAQSPHSLGEALVRSDWLGADPTGDATMVAGGSRVEWQGKAVQTCSPYTCHAVALPAGSVSVDPALSPTGQIAFVEGRASSSYTSDPAQVSAWEAGHTLWVATRGSQKAAPVNGGQGASAPRWSPDGRQLMFVKDDGLWIVPAAGGRPARVASGLAEPADYYGQEQWLFQYAWAAG